MPIRQLEPVGGPSSRGGDTAHPRDDCPPAERSGARCTELPAADRMRLIDHTAECPSARSWRLAMEIDKEGSTEIAAPPALVPSASSAGRVGRPRGGSGDHRLGTALALRWQTPSPDPVVRDGAANVIRSLLAESASLPRKGSASIGQPGPTGSRYDVVVTTTGLDVVAEVRAIERSEYTIEPARLAPLAPGTRLLWRVVAHTPDGRTIASPTYVATVQ